MARDFNGTSDKLSVAVAVVSGYPWTFAGWGNIDNATTSGCIVAVGDTAAGSNAWQLYFAGEDAGDPIRVQSRAASVNQFSTTTTGFTAGAWTYLTGVGASSTSRTVYINGGSSGSNTNSSVPASLDKTSIGVRGMSTDSNFLNGRIADCTIWNVGLTAAEVLMLANGMHPHAMRRTSLVGYWRVGVGSPDPDWSGQANNMTVAGTTVADHVRLGLPFGFDLGWQGAFTAAAVGGDPEGRLIGGKLLHGGLLVNRGVLVG